MKYIKSIIVFDEVMEEMLSPSVKIKILFACKAHRIEVLPGAIVVFIIIRVKQFYEQKFRNTKKIS